MLPSLICAGVLIPVAYLTYKQSIKTRAVGEQTKARLWMFASLGAGAFAVISLLGAFSGQ